MKWLVLVSALVLAGCDRPPTEQSYVALVRDVSEECQKADRGQGWAHSQYSDQAKLQTTYACASYWTGRLDQSQEHFNDLITKIQKNLANHPHEFSSGYRYTKADESDSDVTTSKLRCLVKDKEVPNKIDAYGDVYCEPTTKSIY